MTFSPARGALRFSFGLFVLAWCLLAACGAARAQRQQNRPSFLRAEGVRIVDEQNRPVTLAGVNLGGWLVEEMWMMPLQTKPPAGAPDKDILDHVSLWRTVEKRFGPAGVRQVRAALRDAWITEADFARVRAAGLNCVRLPFLYDLLDEPGGWAYLDRALGWARKHNLYVVLDLHGAPGRQSRDHHTGEANVNRLFFDPAMVAKTEQVWRSVARRYKDHPEVAGYDLLNEPMGAPNNATLYVVQDRLYRAIRQVDARHLIFVEDGYKGIENMPHPAVCGWSNVAFSIHSYTFDAKSEQNHLDRLTQLAASVEKAQKERNVPFYLGEFNLEPAGTPNVMATYVRTLTERGWSWSLWTYKVAGGNGGRSLWGWIYAPGRGEKLDPFRDSLNEMVRKAGRTRTEHLAEYVELRRALGSASGKVAAQQAR